MARATFGATAADFVISVGPGGLLRAAPATLTFWTTATGGTQHTDLLLNGNPVTQIAVGSDGVVPAFQGPDAVSEMWADGGGGSRVRVQAGGPPGPQGLPGGAGPAGPANTLAIGTVSAGASAGASITGAAPAQTLNLTLPAGAAGQPGPPGPIGLTIASTVSGGTYTLNPTHATEYSLTLTGNVSLAIGGMTNGAALTVDVFQDGVGGRTLTLPSDWIGASAVTISTTANTFNRLVISKTPAGIWVQNVSQGTLPASYWSPLAIANADRWTWFNPDSIAGVDGEAVVAADVVDQYGKATLTSVLDAPTLRIANGIKYVTTDGVNDMLYFEYGAPNGRPCVYAAVVKVTGSGPVRVFGGNSTAATEVYVNAANNWAVHGGVELAGGAKNGQWQTLYVVANAASSVIRVNGAETAGDSGNTRAMGGALRIGRNDSTYGAVQIAAGIFLDNVPSAPVLANLESYLNKIRDTLNGL